MTHDSVQPAVWLEPWPEDGLELLRRTNIPEVMDHLGGPESNEKLQSRHKKYLDHWQTGAAKMFRVVIDGVPQGVGSIGYWKITWRGEEVYESGWMIEPRYQGMGIATHALAAALKHAVTEGSMRYVHAFPSPENPASNAVCRNAGFTLLGEVDFEYPVGTPVRSNDWVFDLTTV